MTIDRMPAIAGENAADAERRQIAQAAREFEGLFLLQMLKQMRQSMLAEESDEPGLGAATMFDTIDAELSRHLAGQRGGLSTMLEEALGGARAGAPPAAAAPPIAAPVSLPSPPEPAIAIPDGRISSEFGWRRDPIAGTSRFHRGVDIAAAYGQGVTAAAPGRVVFAGVRGGYGNLIIVEHEGGTETRYAHLAQLDVRQGQSVAAGDIVGRVGQSGRATGPHLHFEVLEAGRPVDPARIGRISTVSADE